MIIKYLCIFELYIYGKAVHLCESCTFMGGGYKHIRVGSGRLTNYTRIS